MGPTSSPTLQTRRTTNCLAPLAKVINSYLGIVEGLHTEKPQTSMSCRMKSTCQQLPVAPRQLSRCFLCLARSCASSCAA
jgi:hypothetical protein